MFKVLIKTKQKNDKNCRVFLREIPVRGILTQPKYLLGIFTSHSGIISKKILLMLAVLLYIILWACSQEYV